jgi:hypothetical protein
MTPRDQIQEHAKTAAAKVQAALEEFEKTTGMAAHPVVQWAKHSELSSSRVSNILTAVRIAYDGEAG